MRRSSSLPHIPAHAPAPKRLRVTPFAKSNSPASLLCLPDDLLLRIFHALTGSTIMNISAFGRLPKAIALASTCRRLRFLFFKSINTIDCTIPHASHTLPLHYHSRICTTCPAVVPVPAVILLVQRCFANLQTLRLPALGLESTALVISTIVERCLQLRSLCFTDQGAINVSLANTLLASRHLTSLTVCEPHDHLLNAMCTSSISLRNVSLMSVSVSRGPLITRFLNRSASNLRSLSIAFFNEMRFLAEPFAFPRHNLHRVYPNMQLDLASSIADVLKFIARNRLSKLPLLSELAVTTLGADLNQEECDLINCPPPVSGLDTLCGAVFFVRTCTSDRSVGHPLRSIVLRTDHLALHASIRALTELLSPLVHLTLHINDLTLGIPPVSPTLVQKCNSTLSSLSHRNLSTWAADCLLRHTVLSVRLESLLQSDVKFSHRSDFSKLHMMDLGSAQFYVKYGRNPEAYRPKLVEFLRRTESLRTIRFSKFVENERESHIGRTLVLDILSHASNVTILELSDEFLITAFYRGGLAEMFIYLANIRTIRFGRFSWACFPNVGLYTRRITEFFHMLPNFFNAVAKSCPQLKHLNLLSTYQTAWPARSRERLALRHALRSLHDLESELPDVETGTVHAQIHLWLRPRHLH